MTIDYFNAIKTYCDYREDFVYQEDEEGQLKVFIGRGIGSAFVVFKEGKEPLVGVEHRDVIYGVGLGMAEYISENLKRTSTLADRFNPHP